MREKERREEKGIKREMGGKRDKKREGKKKR